MKKSIQPILLLFVLIFLPSVIYPAALSMGQGAKWIMTGSRTASQEVDAVWFNPAGLTELPNGFHIAFSQHNLIAHGNIKNDTVIRSSTDDYGQIEDEYKLQGYVPYIMYIFMSYNITDWAFFLGIEGPGGIGGGELPDGTPTEAVGFSFYSVFPHSEYGQLSRIEIRSMEAEGGGGILGPAFGAAYKINDLFSVSLKARLLYGFMYSRAKYDVRLYDQAGVQHQFTFKDGETEMDVTGLGYGYGFGAGVNIKPLKDLNIAIVYDWFSPLEMDIDFKKGDMKLSPGSLYDGMKYRNQVPMRIGTGLGYNIIPELKIMLSIDLGLDTFAEMFGDEDTDLHNDVEGANVSMAGGDYKGKKYDIQHQYNLGVEYNINKTVIVGTGIGYMNVGLKSFHQKDFSQWTDRVDLHIGTEIKWNDNVKIQLAYCVYLGFKAKSDFDLFKTAENVGAVEKGAQSEYQRFAHQIVWGVTGSVFN